MADGVYWFARTCSGSGSSRARTAADRTTLLVRLMAAGPLLASAVPEVARLARDAPERVVAEPILLDFQRMLGHHETRTSDEQEFLMAMQQTWETPDGDASKRCVNGAARAGDRACPTPVRRQIQGERDLARLERWLERAIMARSIADVIDDVS